MSATTTLIADDLKVFLTVARTFLERRGYEVLTAEDGAKAVELARTRHPRLIVLDFEMPTMDGASACAAMRRDPTLAFTPIVVMSATGGEERRRKCLKAGCSHFVVKPAKPHELLEIIARILSVRERKPAHMSVVFGEEGPSGGKQHIGKAGNISGTGMLLLTGKTVPVGALLRLEFVLPATRRTLAVRGKVTRVDQDSQGTFGAGIHFVDLNEADQKQILDYVSG